MTGFIPSVTASGRVINLAAPDAADICLFDIADHLSQTNRYNGGTVFPVNVAAHSIAVYREVTRQTADPVVRMAALLHDAHEFVVGDITRPAHRAIVRHLVEAAQYDPIREMKRLVDAAIWRAVFQDGQAALADLTHPAVKAADRAVCAAEIRDVKIAPPGGWPAPAETADPAPGITRPCPPDEARRRFLELFAQLALDTGADGPAARAFFDRFHGASDDAEELDRAWPAVL